MHFQKCQISPQKNGERGTRQRGELYLLCSHEHQSGVDLFQADEAAVTDIVQERDSLHILLDS